MDVSISAEEIDHVLSSLKMKINFIQTGRSSLTPQQAQSQGKSHLIKPLSDEEMELVLRLKNLVKRISQIKNNNARLIGV